MIVSLARLVSVRTSSFTLASATTIASLAFAAGCSHAPKPANAAGNESSTTALTAGEMPGKSAQELPPMIEVSDGPSAHPAGHDGNEARLVVSKSIVIHCPNVQSLADRPFRGRAEEAWIAVLGSVARCLNDGELGGARLQVTGASRTSTAVSYVLVRLGVDQARIQPVDSFEQDLCMHDRGCPLTTIRLDLAPAEDMGTEADRR